MIAVIFNELPTRIGRLVKVGILRCVTRRRADYFLFSFPSASNVDSFSSLLDFEKRKNPLARSLIIIENESLPRTRSYFNVLHCIALQLAWRRMQEEEKKQSWSFNVLAK